MSAFTHCLPPASPGLWACAFTAAAMPVKTHCDQCLGFSNLLSSPVSSFSASPLNCEETEPEGGSVMCSQSHSWQPGRVKVQSRSAEPWHATVLPSAGMLRPTRGHAIQPLSCPQLCEVLVCDL